jgi:hypothetical protein
LSYGCLLYRRLTNEGILDLPTPCFLNILLPTTNFSLISFLDTIEPSHPVYTSGFAYKREYCALHLNKFSIVAQSIAKTVLEHKLDHCGFPKISNYLFLDNMSTQEP